MINEGRGSGELSIGNFLRNDVHDGASLASEGVLAPSEDTLDGRVKRVILAGVHVVARVPLVATLSRDDLVLKHLCVAPLLDTQTTTRTVLFVVSGTRHHLCRETSVRGLKQLCEHIYYYY